MASCGCTTPGKITAIPASSSVFLPVSFNTGGRPGRIKQSVIVVTREHPNAPLVVPITGEVVPVVRISPATVQLGFVRSGERKAFAVTVASRDAKPLPVSGARTSGPVRANITRGATNTTVQVSGTLTGPGLAGEYRESVVLTLNDPLLPEVTIPVQFNVPSEYKMAPANINFGLVETGKVISKTIRLEGVFPNGLRVTKAPADLSVALRRVSASVYALDARLSAAGRPGLLSDRVVLATGNARQPAIVVPVYAAPAVAPY